MTTIASNHDLAERIEQLVREHIAASRKVAKEAIDRTFAEASGESTRQPPRTKRTQQRRRAPDEVLALSEQLYAAVCEMPGETMTVLARQVGVTSRELTVPGARLKQAGRVRVVGQRSRMRYFPMASESRGDKAVKA